MKTLRIVVLFGLLGPIVQGCSGEKKPVEKSGKEERTSDQNTLDASDRGYRKLADDLYKGEGSVIYYRSIDVSAADGNHHPKRGVYSYNGSLFLDTVINGDSTHVVAPIYKRVDTLTFHRTPDRDDYPGYKFYEDARHFYFVVPQADGGVLQGRRK